MAKGKQRIAVDGSDGGLRRGLPGLDALREKLPVEPSPAASPAPASDVGPSIDCVADGPPARSTVWSRASRLVVRRERKGHGGKTASRIEGLVGSTRELEDAAREVKRALGCGAIVDGRDVVIQGDQGERLVAFLARRGTRKIVVGS